MLYTATKGRNGLKEKFWSSSQAHLVRSSAIVVERKEQDRLHST
jgi:hypothetical protein